MNYCGLLGKNIKYSKSPQIHNEYYAKHRIKLDYKIYDIQKNDIPDFLRCLKYNGIIGFNVTIPYKEYIIKFLTGMEQNATEIGSVNTVACINNELIGYNTDFYGFIESLAKYNIDVSDKKALVIGNGGVSKSVIHALTSLNIGSIDIIARNFKKSETKLLNYNINREFVWGENILTEDYNLIFNCTPIGGANYMNMSPLKLNALGKNTTVYDLNYIPEKSILLSQAEKLGAKIVNGELMLKLQAYKAIDIWKNIINEGEKK